ncbi:hypothetical protein SNEBB_003714 [Seison nebaliae]|nr:hypothetical protein SNEBB_003714 [Seison nebaliae]
MNTTIFDNDGMEGSVRDKESFILSKEARCYDNIFEDDETDDALHVTKPLRSDTFPSSYGNTPWMMVVSRGMQTEETKDHARKFDEYKKEKPLSGSEANNGNLSVEKTYSEDERIRILLNALISSDSIIAKLKGDNIQQFDATTSTVDLHQSSTSNFSLWKNIIRTSNSITPTNITTTAAAAPVEKKNKSKILKLSSISSSSSSTRTTITSPSSLIGTHSLAITKPPENNTTQTSDSSQPNNSHKTKAKILFRTTSAKFRNNVPWINHACSTGRQHLNNVCRQFIPMKTTDTFMALSPTRDNDDKSKDEKELDNMENVIVDKTTETSPAHREVWDKKIEFLLAVIGFAVDLGNVWRFPYICYRNGGGAFFIPYFVFFIFAGLPLFYMELALGQFQQTGVFTVWSRICPMMKGVAFGIVIMNTFMAMFYNTMISWAVYYFFDSFRREVPWKGCHNPWNNHCCLTIDDTKNYGKISSKNLTNDQIRNEYYWSTNITDYVKWPDNMNSTTNTTNIIHNGTLFRGNGTILCETIHTPTEQYFLNKILEINKADGINNLGGVKWETALCLLLVYTIVYFALWKGVKSSGKVVWFTALAPYVILFILLIRGVTLKGSTQGILFYLNPKWAKLKDFAVWQDAAAQVFFSLGPGFGTLLALSSYNKRNNNCYKDAIACSIINCLTSIIAGFVVFSVLGHMAYVKETNVENVTKQGPELVYVAYPQAIALMNGSTFWSLVFFLMVITLGVDSTFGGFESVLTGLCDQSAFLAKRRELFVLGVMMFAYCVSLSTCTYGGNYLIHMLNEYAIAPAILLIAFCETVALNWIYGTNRFSDDVKSMLGFRPGRFWRVTWAIIAPFFLLIVFITIIYYITLSPLVLNSYVYPDWIQRLRWIIIFCTLVPIPLYMIFQFVTTPGTFFDRIRRMTTPETSPPPLEISEAEDV